MTTFLKSALTALALTLATVTVADASPAAAHRMSATHAVAGKSTVTRAGATKVRAHGIKGALATHHHTHVAHLTARHATAVRHGARKRVARTRGFRHVAEAHHGAAKGGIIR